MSALIAQAVDLHRDHAYMPFWQCIELARHLQAQTAQARRRCEARQEAGEGSRARDHTLVRLPRACVRRAVCAVNPVD
jgi:hypothetical protein